MFSYISYLVFLVKTYITMVTLSQLVNEYYCITTEKNLKFLDHFLTVVVFPLASLNCEFVRLYLFLVTDHHEVCWSHILQNVCQWEFFCCASHS